jgi:hypothetical protein
VVVSLSAQAPGPPSSPATALNRRDISGFWWLGYDGRKVPPANLVPSVTDAVRRKLAAADVHTTRWCNLVGMPALMDMGRPLDVRQGETMIVMVPEVANASPRYVYLNRSAHIDPDVYDPSTNGDSIGRWDGDTLIVDTTGFHDTHGLMAIPGGAYRTATARLVERYALLGDGNTLSVTFTWTDPKMFRAPHVYEFRYLRYPAHYEAITPAPCNPWDSLRSSFFEAPAAPKPAASPAGR